MGEPVSAGVARAAGQVAARGGGWLLRRLRPDTSAAALTVHADNLAERVMVAETRRLGELAVVRGAGVDVSFDARQRIRAAGGEILGALSEVGGYYRGLRPGRLVVLGEAGTGKTVLALHLLVDVLEHRLDDPARPGPVPVRVNAAGWDGGRGFTEWFAGVLASDYSVLPRVARMLIQTGRVLPVLDGLDEMDPLDAPPVCARGALDRLNETPWRGRPVIVTCRSEVYEKARALGSPDVDAGLHAATAVELRPLTTAEMVGFLDACRKSVGVDPERWAPVVGRLAREPGGVLAEALRTPWFLTLTVQLLRREGEAGGRELAAASGVEAVRDRLFSALIPAAVDALPGEDGPERRYTEDRVHFWLHNLACHLEMRRERSRGGTDIALHELWELAGRRSCRLLHGLVSGLLCGLVWGLMYGHTTGLVLGLLFGLVPGLLPTPAPRRIVWRVRTKGALLAALRRVLVFVLQWALVLAFLGWGLGLGLVDGLVSGLVWGLWLGVMSALVFRPEPDPRSRLRDERRVISDDAISGLVSGLVVALGFVLVTGVVTGVRVVLGVVEEPAVVLGADEPELRFVLPVGIILVTFGLVSAAASVRYTCASLLFLVRGVFPARPAPFLDWARHAGLLRVTGAAYQYRHESYRDWLVQHPAR
jgi:hypothetical protein